jgi:predicted CXXCH cytochrome family protein
VVQMIYLWALLLAALLLGHEGTFAQGGIQGTKHDLSFSDFSSTRIGHQTASCEFCHTPHGTVANREAPLWNLGQTKALYQIYTSPTLDVDTSAGPNGVSLTCLSCHDGTLAPDVLRNINGSSGFLNGMPAENGAGTSHNENSGNSTPVTGIANLGMDLRNDHPISIHYEDARSPSANRADGRAGFRSVIVDGTKKCVARPDVTSCSDPEALPLSSAIPGGPPDYVQCTSCHDPHQNPDMPTFLRKPNNGSSLCLTCHIKDG